MIFLSSVSLFYFRVLRSQGTKSEKRESMIFICIKNRACEKTKLPLKTLNRRFHSAVEAAESDRRIEPEKETDLKYLNRRFHSAARPQIITAEFILRTGEKTAVSFGGFETAE